MRKTIRRVVLAGALVFYSGLAIANGYIDPATGIYYPSITPEITINVETGRCFHAVSKGLIPIGTEEYYEERESIIEQQYEESIQRPVDPQTVEVPE